MTDPATAWQLYPDATGPETAVYAVELSQKIEELQASGLSKVEAVKQVWDHERSETGAFMLPTGEVCILPPSFNAEILHGLGSTPEANDLRGQIYSAASLSGTDYTHWRNLKMADFLERIETDPMLKAVHENWDSLNNAERYTAAKILTKHFHEVFGTTEPDLVGAAKFAKGDELEGIYYTESDILAYNQNKFGKGGIFNDQPPALEYSGFVKIMAHENYHRLQDDLVERLNVIEEIEKNVLEELGAEHIADLDLAARQVYDSLVSARMNLDLHLPGGAQDPVNDGLRWHGNGQFGTLRGPALMYRENWEEGAYLNADRSNPGEDIDYHNNPVESDAYRTKTPINSFMLSTNTPETRQKILETLRATESYDKFAAIRQQKWDDTVTKDIKDRYEEGYGTDTTEVVEVIQPAKNIPEAPEQQPTLEPVPLKAESPSP